MVRRIDCNQLRALQKNFAHVGIHDQVDIALAVAQFDVGQAVPLLGQRQQVFAEEGDLLDVNAEFAGAGAEQVSADADVVAEVEQFVEFESLVADGVFLDVDLQPLAALLQVGEPGLAHKANRHDASGHAHVDARLVQFLGGLRRVLRQNLLQRVGEFVLAAVGGLTERLNLLQLFAAQVINMVVECQGSPFSS